MNDHEEHYCETFESHLCAMDSPTRPWYLSTKAIYRVVNKATRAVQNNHIVFDQSLHGIKELTKLLHSKSQREVLYINLEKAQALIDKLDIIRSDQFVVLGDGNDHCRIELSIALRDLVASIAEQQKLAADFLSTRAIESQSFEESAFGKYIGSSQLYQTVVTELQTAQSKVKTQYPNMYARVEELAIEGITTAQALRAQLVEHTHNAQRYYTDKLEQADSTFRSTSAQLVYRAHPYVHAAYTRGAPVVATALQWSQPFLRLFRPLLEPLRARAERQINTLANNSLTGPSVVHLLDQAKTVLEKTKEYCESPAPGASLQATFLLSQERKGGTVPALEVEEGIRL